MKQKRFWTIDYAAELGEQTLEWIDFHVQHDKGAIRLVERFARSAGKVGCHILDTQAKYEQTLKQLALLKNKLVKLGVSMPPSSADSLPSSPPSSDS